MMIIDRVLPCIWLLGREADAFRYACPQVFNIDTVGGGNFPGESFPHATDELKCAILQVNVPLSCLQEQPSSSRLPVLVYIHGGGFVLGKIDEQHNTSLMVEQSILDDQPIISASLQYRVGALGYLHTPEAGHANLALNDQRNALLWLQKFVEGFGGDKKKVTVFGESAGSMSICAHMLRQPPPSGPLFQRAILMSGIIGPTTVPLSLENASKTYKNFLKTVGVVEEGEAGLERLRQLDVQKIVDASAEHRAAGDMWLSVQDPQWFGDEAGCITWDRIPELLGKCEWVNEIVLGTTGFEVSRCSMIVHSVRNLPKHTGRYANVGNRRCQPGCFPQRHCNSAGRRERGNC
jgi:carboxylesterase type B